MEKQQAKFLGAALLFMGIVGFSVWDLTRPEPQADEGEKPKRSKVWERAAQMERNSQKMSTRIWRGTSSERERWKRQEEELERINREGEAKFRANVGKSHEFHKGYLTRIDALKYVRQGETIRRDGQREIKCSKTGWYYETVTLSRLGAVTSLQYCGTTAFDQ